MTAVLWTAAELARATGGMLARPFDATGVSIDTRSLRTGDLFVALRGDHSDGHAHVAAALAQGAAGALVHAVPEGVSSSAPLLRVADTRGALVALGAAARARFGGKVVAVTGSVGKTTTKDMLRLCLSQADRGEAGAAHAAEASHNNHWGVPLTLARLPKAAPAGIVEIGMNHAGEIAPLAVLARPHVAIVTSVGSAHVGQLGSLEAIAAEKAKIASGLEVGGTAVLPGDAAMLGILRAAAAGHRVVTFGAAAGCDVRLLTLVAAAGHSDVAADVMGHRVAFRLGAPGRHMALNALACLAAAAVLGVDVDAAAAALAGFAAGAGRGAMRRLALAEGTALLLDESYNASADSVRAALGVLALQPATRRIAALGDMRELGARSRAEHAGLANAACGAADLVFTCGTDMAALHDALPPARRGGHVADAEALAALLPGVVRAGDVVLVKGSNGSRMRLVIAALDALGQTSRAA